ncbi:MAG TPA: cbb3-type cytochrome c oxidase subunit I [Acidimicrobiales bacterium]|nr:cbb3-type cytochrome c oxidase subunit I [Acidimicrobiales bacterium]
MAQDTSTATGSPPPNLGGWLDSTDHKRVGLLYVYAALGFLVIGGVAGFLLRAELAETGNQFLGDDYGRTFSLHATVLGVLCLPALWVGISSHLVPLQIGASRVAFPRALASSFWLYLTGGVLLIGTYANDGLRIAGVTVSAPPAAPKGGAAAANTLWVTALGMVGVASLIAAVVLVTTVATLRAPGMRFERLPLFTWATFASGLVVILATPVLLAGLLVAYLDVHFGSRLFVSDGGPALWQHTVWLFGRPEAFLLLLPGLGVACEVVATHARRPLLGFAAARAALLAFAALSLLAWASGPSAVRAIAPPTSTVATALAALPLGVLVLAWLGTLAKGRPRIHSSLLFVAGAVVLLGFAALNAAIAAVVSVHGTAWSNGFLHAALFSPPLLLAAAALHHWAPKLWGRQLPGGAAALTALLLTLGSLVHSGAAFLLGYDGQPWHAAEGDGDAFTNLNRLASLGGALTVLGVILLIVSVARVAGASDTDDAADDPDTVSGLTLEWAAPSPPPPHNFDEVPVVRSAEPLSEVPA